MDPFGRYIFILYNVGNVGGGTVFGGNDVVPFPRMNFGKSGFLKIKLLIFYSDAVVPLMTASKICKDNNLTFYGSMVNLQIAHLQVRRFPFSTVCQFCCHLVSSI